MLCSKIWYMVSELVLQTIVLLYDPILHTNIYFVQT